MSSPSEQGKASGEDRKGLSKFIRRASRVLRPKSVGSVPSELIAAQGEPDTSGPKPAATPTTEAKSTGPLSSHPSAAPAPAPAPEAAKAAMSSEARDTPVHLNVHKATDPTPVQIPRRDIKDAKALGKIQQEKAQILFAKYGLTLEAKDWTPLSRSGAGEVEWVEKKVRLRVHRQCHHCATSFGSAKECASCSHVRCKKCPRFPAKPGSAAAAATASAPAPTEGSAKVEKELKPTAPARAGVSDVEMGGVDEETDVDLAALVAPPIHLQIDPKDQTDKHILKSTSGIHQYRGQDVQFRPPTHRVRRFCHKCKALFKGRATSCESCGHQRCPECPREPHKPAKYPTGYPGDVPEPEPLYPTLERVWRKPRHRVRYICENCHTVFANSGERECRECKHARCNSCIRYPPIKPAKKQSEEVLKSLEGRFDGLQLLSQ